MRKIGERIGAILSSNGGTCKFLGYGVYTGDYVPPPEVAGFLHDAGIENPRLDLDDGSIVWGCQCWWGSEDAVKKELNKYDKVEKVCL